MTGASDSSKLVSGESARGTAEAKIAAPIRNKTNIARNRITVATASFFKLLRRVGLVNGRFWQCGRQPPDGNLLMYCAALLTVVRLLPFFTSPLYFVSSGTIVISSFSV
jgi:hypothetical protein